MALTYPLDLLAGFPGWTTQFEPLYRQELSRQANGRTRPKDLGSPLWMGAWQSRSLSPNELDHWRARLEAMEGGIKEFLGYPLSRCWPIAYPGNTMPTGWFIGRRWDSDAELGQLTVSNATSSIAGGVLTLNCQDDSHVTTPGGVNLRADSYDLVRLRARRVSGSGWQGQLYFQTNAGFFGAVSIPEPSGFGDWTILEWRMRGQEGWSGTIDFVRIDLGGAETTIEIDWIEVGSTTFSVATLASVGANRKSISLGTAPIGYQVSIGDMVEIGEGDLHRVMEIATASASGNTPLFEVRPHIWPGVAAGAPVRLVKPSCPMTIVSGSVSSQADPSTGRGVVSFQAIESR